MIEEWLDQILSEQDREEKEKAFETNLILTTTVRSSDPIRIQRGCSGWPSEAKWPSEASEASSTSSPRVTTTSRSDFIYLDMFKRYVLVGFLGDFAL